MPDDSMPRTFEKIIALVLIVAWMGGTLAMMFPALETTGFRSPLSYF